MCLHPIIDFGFTFEHAVTAMVVMQLDGTILQSNMSAQRLFDCTHDELISLFHAERNHQNLQELLHRSQILLSENQKYADMEQCYHLHSSHKICTTVNLTLTEHITSQETLVFIQFQDKTAHRMVESRLEIVKTKLEEQEQSYHQLLEDLQHAVLITKDGVILYTNRAGLDLVGAAAMDEIIGRSTLDLVDKNYHGLVLERRSKIMNNSRLGSVRYRINRLDGERRYVDGFSLPISYQNQDAVLGVFNDVTHLLKEEERLMQSEKLSIAGQLAAGIAHEIRNPLTSINGFMKLIRSTKRNEERYFSIVESELKRIELIVNELLILSKPHQSYDKKPTELISLLEQVITLMNAQAAMKNVQIISSFTLSEVWIHGEANQLKQVFINLIKNAIESMITSGEIHVNVKVQDNKVLVMVQDSGSGISPEQLKLIGNPFYTTKDTGTGLGLMICYNIIHNHDGEIHVDSVLNQGTTFSIKIPLLPM